MSRTFTAEFPRKAHNGPSENPRPAGGRRKPTPLCDRPGNVRAVRTRRKSRLSAVALIAGLALAGCGGTTELISGPGPDIGVKSKTPQAGQKLGFPALATKNTTRVAGGDPVADAAGVALAVFPSAVAGTHPTAVTIAPTDNWQAAIAAASLMAPPIRAPILLSGSSSLPSASRDALARSRRRVPGRSAACR